MNSVGLEIDDLKAISILRHLTDDKLDDIQTVHVYGSHRSSFEGLSALYVTKHDEVYLAGFDSLVGKCCTKEGPHGHKRAVMQSKKVEELSGRGVKKIVVGEEFGAALCGVGNELYLWGSDVGSIVPAGLSRLALEGHCSGACCPKCSSKLDKSGSYELLSYCTCSGGVVYRNRVSALPAPTDWTGPTHIALGYKATGTAPQMTNLFCARCGKNQPCKVVAVSDSLLYCSSSPEPHHLIDGRSLIPTIPPQTNPAPHKVTFNSSPQIIDVAAGKNFLLLHTSTGLIIWGELGGVKYDIEVLNTDTISIARLSCGSSHIAVVSDEGGLYTCGIGDKGQLGYDWTSGMGHMTLKEVSLKEPAVDVACGRHSTVCHLQNGTCVVYGVLTKLIPCGTWAMNLLDSVLICVPTAACHMEIVERSLELFNRFDRKHLSDLTGDHSDTFIHLHGMNVDGLSKCSVRKVDACHQTDFELLETEHKLDACHQTDFKLLKTECPAKSENDATTSAHQSLNVARLYGQHILSDLTLKLSDGNFPVHRSVLFTASAYFSQLFTDSESPGVLDMTSYNADAYRGLLRYFYGVPIGQLSASDHFDLYVLALSYKEDWISNDVLSKLKNLLDSNNVLFLHDRAKAANASELIAACKTFMNAPEFKRSLWDKFSQDEDMVVELLRVSLSKKP